MREQRKGCGCVHWIENGRLVMVDFRECTVRDDGLYLGLIEKMNRSGFVPQSNLSDTNHEKAE